MFIARSCTKGAPVRGPFATLRNARQLCTQTEAQPAVAEDAPSDSSQTQKKGLDFKQRLGYKAQMSLLRKQFRQEWKIQEDRRLAKIREEKDRVKRLKASREASRQSTSVQRQEEIKAMLELQRQQEREHRKIQEERRRKKEEELDQRRMDIVEKLSKESESWISEEDLEKKVAAQLFTPSPFNKETDMMAEVFGGATAEMYARRHRRQAPQTSSEGSVAYN